MVARCHAKLWPLSVQSHRPAGEGKVKRTVTGAAQYVVLRRNLMLHIFKKSGGNRVRRVIGVFSSTSGLHQHVVFSGVWLECI